MGGKKIIFAAKCFYLPCTMKIYIEKYDSKFRPGPYFSKIGFRLESFFLISLNEDQMNLAQD